MKKIIMGMLSLMAFVFSVSKENYAYTGFFDPSNISYHGKECQSFNDTIFEDLYNDVEIDATITVVENIKHLQKVTSIGMLSEVTEADAGCSPTATQHKAAFSEQSWHPVWAAIHDYECYTDLKESFVEPMLANGIEAANLPSEYIAYKLKNLSPAVKEDAKLFIWFGEKLAANSDDTVAGIITPGKDVKFINLVDGFWTKIFAIVAGDATKLTAGLATKNAQTSFANQKFNSTDTTNKVATNVFSDLQTDADARLYGLENKVILCTQSLAIQYLKELEAVSGVPQAFDVLTNGMKVINRWGTLIIPMPFWDRMILKWNLNSTSTAAYLPHRAILTTKDVLLAGFDSKSAIEQWQIWYEKKDKKIYTYGMYKLDTMIFKDYFIQTAY